MQPLGEHWRFDQSVTDVFENMLARSIPAYAAMPALVFDLGATLVQPNRTRDEFVLALHHDNIEALLGPNVTPANE